MAKIIQCVFQRRRIGLGVEEPPASSALLPCWGQHLVSRARTRLKSWLRSDQWYDSAVTLPLCLRFLIYKMVSQHYLM